MISILLTTDYRPTLADALAAIQAQTRKDFELLLLDWKPEWACPVAWCFNEAFRRGMVHGDYVCTAYDDDLLYPDFLHMMAGTLDLMPTVDAVWCSQNRSTFDGDNAIHEGVIRAESYRTSDFDCQVDGGQVMLRRSVLERIEQPYMPESADECFHSDGLFLERLASVGVGFWPIPQVLCENRRTPWSKFRRLKI